MTKQEFIRDYREAIDRVIRSYNPCPPPITNKERELWILNDEGLYHWARSKGVRI